MTDFYYFNNAATSWPKPEPVYRAIDNFLRQSGSSSGRSGHAYLEADRVLYNTRERVANFLGAGEPSKIVFTLNATDSLNMAIKGILEAGDHVLYTALEHNSVFRPLGSLRQAGLISTTMIPCFSDGTPDLDFLEKNIRPNTKMLVVNHASNVIGTIQPVKEIGEIARRYGLVYLVDAAQTAGVLPINVQEMQVDLLAFTGHKGLFGPQGTGGLYVCPRLRLKPWREGGTGSRSESDRQPDTMPEYLEAGTMNGPGLAGLNAGLQFIEETGLENIRRHENSLAGMLREGLQEIPRIKIYGPSNPARSVPVVSFTLEGVDCGELGHILEDEYGIVTRTGLHCAPEAHRAVGTFPRGTVRVSLSYFNRMEEIDYFLDTLKEIINRAGRL